MIRQIEPPIGCSATPRVRFLRRYPIMSARGGRGGGRRSNNRSAPYAGSSSSSKGDQNKRVFVANMAYSTSWQDLKDHMKQVGEVAYCDIIPEKGSTLSSGSGLVEYATVGMAKKAIAQLNRSELDGWEIYVREERTGLSIGQGARQPEGGGPKLPAPPP